MSALYQAYGQIPFYHTPTTYCVDYVHGSDANAGSVNFPWQTIRYASTQAQPGDLVYSRQGVHVLCDDVYPGDNWNPNGLVGVFCSGWSGAPITFEPYPGDGPVIWTTAGNYPWTYVSTTTDARAYYSSQLPNVSNQGRFATYGSVGDAHATSAIPQNGWPATPVFRMARCNALSSSPTFGCTVTANSANSTINGISVTAGASMSFSSTGTVPAPLSAGTTYYAVNAAYTSFQVSASSGGSPITLTNNGSGTITANISVQNITAWPLLNSMFMGLGYMNYGYSAYANYLQQYYGAAFSQTVAPAWWIYQMPLGGAWPSNGSYPASWEWRLTYNATNSAGPIGTVVGVDGSGGITNYWRSSSLTGTFTPAGSCTGSITIGGYAGLANADDVSVIGSLPQAFQNPQYLVNNMGGAWNATTNQSPVLDPVTQTSLVMDLSFFDPTVFSSGGIANPSSGPSTSWTTLYFKSNDLNAINPISSPPYQSSRSQIKFDCSYVTINGIQISYCIWSVDPFNYQNLTIENCRIVSTATGSNLAAGTNFLFTQNYCDMQGGGLVYANYLQNWSNQLYHGIYFGLGVNVQFTKNFFGRVRGGYNFQDWTNGLQNATFQGNVVVAVEGLCALYLSGNNVVVNQNIILGMADVWRGYTIQASVGIGILNNGYYGPSSGWDVTGNYIEAESPATVHGIQLVSTSGTFANNLLENPAISAANSSNFLESHPTYGQAMQYYQQYVSEETLGTVVLITSPGVYYFVGSAGILNVNGVTLPMTYNGTTLEIEGVPIPVGATFAIGRFVITNNGPLTTPYSGIQFSAVLNQQVNLHGCSPFVMSGSVAQE